MQVIKHRILEETNKVDDLRNMIYKDNSIINIDGNKYELKIDENGEISIRRYNEKYKMWVRVIFSNEKDKVCDASFITEILSKQYIERIAGTDL